MKIKVSEAQGAVLDWLVAKCDVGAEFICEIGDPHFYSTDWSQGGPIIEREGIELLCESLGFRWVAIPQKGPEWRGPTPLIAAMRCYVASKLGDEVEIPEGLL